MLFSRQQSQNGPDMRISTVTPTGKILSSEANAVIHRPRPCTGHRIQKRRRASSYMMGECSRFGASSRPCSDFF
jgi:hypothetical protein